MDIKIYKEKIKELLANTSISKNNIFEYDFSEYKDEFDEVFSFYQENLINNSKYGITPSVIFFNNNLTVNAKAGKDNSYYIISINMGTIVKLIEMFKEKTDLLDEENNKDFLEFEAFLDIPINNLMYQNAFHFTFYHEMAHLIQKSEFLENNLYEHLDNSNDFSERRHLLELDADEFSSISIGSHIIQYSEKMFGDDLTDEQFENLLVIACSSVFLYLLSFPSNIRKIHYDRFSHPHPVIRVLSIIFAIVSYCIESLQSKGTDITLNSKETVNKTFEFSKSLSESFFEGSNPISEFQESLEEEGLCILDYLTKYQNLKINDRTLAVYKWNQMVTKIKKSQ